VEDRIVSDVIYLYGLVPNDAPLPPAELRGVGAAAVQLIDLGDVQAAISHLNDPALQPDAVEQRLDDLRWVGEQGLAHEQVVAWFVDRADILPARLFTMHSSEAALRAAVRDTLPLMAARLREFAGRREWNLKVAYDTNTLAQHGGEVSDELRALAEEIAAAPAGRRYLLEKKRADVAKVEIRRAAKRLADELLETLAAHALATRVLPLSTDATLGTVVLTAALLVERNRDVALQQTAAARIALLSQLGLSITFTGPWAPYRFVASDVVA
jgi:hypothetical protein